MKTFKLVSALVLSITIIVVGSAFNSDIKSPSQQKFYNTDSYSWVNSNLFAIGTVPSSPINTYANWDQGTNITGGFLYLSQVDVSYLGFPPSAQQVFDAVKAEYDLLSSLGSCILS